MSQTPDVMELLAQAVAPYLGRNGPVMRASGTPISPYLYEHGGLFGVCGADPVLINALVGPMGYEAKIPWVGTKYDTPLAHYLTSIASTGYTQSTLCGDCGTPSFKRCTLTTCFGRICQATEEMNIDSIGVYANPGIPQLALYGAITDPSGNVLVGQGQPVTNMFTLQLVGAAYNLRRQLGVEKWNGNPTGNTGGRQFMTGFDLLINTGHNDVPSGLACPGLDSIIKNYGNNIVGAAGSPSILSYIAAVIRSIKYRISTAGFDDAAAIIDIVMHPTQWDCVAAAAACEYGLTCNSWTASGLREMTNDALAVADIRDAMMAGMYLKIDGKQYPVTLDNGIPVTNRPYGSETKRCSTIYIIPRQVPGIPAVTDSPGNGYTCWGEYQDFTQTAGDVLAWFRRTFGASLVDVTDGGRYIVAPTTSGGLCFDARVVTKPRVRLLTPQFAGRVTNVCCIPLGTYPDVSGSGGVYEVDGGASTSPIPYLYGDCWPTHIGSTPPRPQ